MRIPSEKYFSDGVPSEKYPQKYNDRKIQLFCVFTVKQFFCGCYTHRKIMFGQIKNKIYAHYSSQKKEKPNRKIIFLLVLSRQSCRGALAGKKCIFLLG